MKSSKNSTLKSKELCEQRKALEKEMNAYLSSKNPEFAEALKKSEAAREKLDALRKKKCQAKAARRKKKKEQK